MLRALRVELVKTFAQRGTYVGFPVLAALIALIVWGLWRHGPADREFERTAGRDMLVAGHVTTAPFVMQFILPTIIELLMPLMIAAVVGGLVAGEVQSGTMRTMLLRPIPRLRLLAAKLGAGWVYTFSLCVFAVLLGSALCYLVFKAGDMLSLSADGLVVFSHDEAIARLALAYGLATVGRLVIAVLALMFSCLFDNGLTAAALTVACLIFMGALEHIPYFEQFQCYFLTWHLDVYRLALEADIDWPAVGQRTLGLSAYSVVAFAVAAIAFSRRDFS